MKIMSKKISPDTLLLLLDNLDEQEMTDVFLHMMAKKTLRQKFTRCFQLNSLTDDGCWKNFRFSKEDINRLKDGLQIPDFVNTLNCLRVPGVEALCVLLRRLAYPNRLCDIAPLFRRCQYDISYVFSAMLNHIYNHFHQKLENLNHAWLNCVALSNAVASKGAPLQNCIGFLDGTVRPIARPSRNQREVFNGHKRVHALKYQSLMLPNGIIGHMYGPLTGRRHDSALLAQSNLLDQLTHLGDFSIYGDPAYPLKRNLIVPFRGAHLTNAQQEFNKQMSKVRTSVEWGFGQIIQLFAFLDFKKNHKLLLQPVGKYYLVGALLYNCHVCLYGSVTSNYFQCAPPTLEEYLQ